MAFDSREEIFELLCIRVMYFLEVLVVRNVPDDIQSAEPKHQASCKACGAEYSLHYTEKEAIPS